MVLCVNAIQNICGTVTFTQGQGQKGPDLCLSNIAIYLRTIKATDIKFGTIVPCGQTLQNMCCTVTRSRSKVKKATLPFFLETIKAAVAVLLRGGLLQNILCTVTFTQGQSHIKATVT